jgi:hypothetical protein
MIKKLLRITETLDENMKYAAADFISDIMLRMSQIDNDDVTDILHSGEEAPEDEIHPFKAKVRGDIGEILEGDPYNGGVIDLENNRDNVLDYYGSRDPELANIIDEFTDPDAPGRKQPGELIFGPHTIKIPRNKTKFQKLISDNDPDDIRQRRLDEFGSGTGLTRRFLSTPEQLRGNTEDYQDYQDSALNDKYQRLRSHNQYWGTSSHNTDRDLKLDKILQQNIGVPLRQLDEMDQEMSPELGKKPARMVEKPYRAWDTKSLDFFDKKSPSYNPDLMNLLLEIKTEELMQKYAPLGLSEEEAQKLAFAVLLGRGFDLKKTNRTPKEEQLAGYLEDNPNMSTPGGLKSFMPGQTYEAEVYKRPKDENGNTTRNRYINYNPETGNAGGFMS